MTNACFRSKFSKSDFPFMAGQNEPNNESVRLDLPLPTAGQPPDSNLKSRETVRIQLPVRDAQHAEPTQLVEPSSQPSVAPAPAAPPSAPFELTKETARISSAPPPHPAATEMEKAEGFVGVPKVAPHNPPVAVAAAGKNPMLFWWILLGISALILLIQIWTYLS
jgi:hypothetical protein